MGKAAKFLGPHHLLRLETVENPRPGPDEVLLRIRGAGICHSDIRILEGIGYPVKPPRTIGHEIAGEIVEVGSNVDSYGAGDRVAVYFGGTCNRCRYCLEGKGSRCLYPAERPIYGMTVDGGFAEYCRVEAINLVKIPSNVGWEFAATLGCAGVTAYHAVNYVGQIGLGLNVGVYGVGGVGLYAVQFAKLCGANVIAIDKNRDQLEMATKDFGADHAVDVSISGKSVADQVRELTDGMGVDVMLDMVSIEETATNSFGTLAGKGGLANGGRLVFVAFPDKLTFDGALFVRNEYSVTGSRFGTKDELQRIVELAGNGRIKSSVTRTFGLDKVNEAIDLVRKGDVRGRACISLS